MTHRSLLVVPRASSSDTKVGQPRPAPRRALIGSTIDGKYRVRDVIGEGGMGSVFEAEQLNIRRLVAIKVLHPAQAKKAVAVKRFHQEARAVGSIGHPNICEVYDMGSLEDGSPYLVLERLAGQTLSTRLGAEGRVSCAEAVDIFTQVSSGLIAAHERGILHRDIKPENVFLSQRPGCPPIVKLLDFGVSKMLAPSPKDDFDDETLTKTGMVMGTPYYMAPEQARGERDLDGRVDVYACGVVMYEILAGRRPFLGANYNALLLAILTGSPSPLRSLEPSVTPAVERLVAKAMSRSRDDRFTSAAEFRQALIELAAKLVPGAAPSAPNTLPQLPQEAPVIASAPSIEIPIAFVDSDELMLEEDNPTTTAKRAVDAYADQSTDRTVRMSHDEIAKRIPPPRPRPKSVPDTDQTPSTAFDEDTAKMNEREVADVAEAMRVAREKERQRIKR